MSTWVLYFALTFIGGSTGGLLRYGVSTWVARRSGEGFPLGTLSVNVSGAFAIGLLWALPWGSGETAELARPLLFAGLLGGYTTVSSFSLQSLELLQNGHGLRALVNILASFVLCLAAVAAGAAAGQWI